MIQNLGIGEAFVTSLNEKGIPTPLVHTFLISPESRMGPLTAKEIDDLVTQSELVKKYENRIDKESAYEILTKRMNPEHHQINDNQNNRTSIPKTKEEPSLFESIMKNPMVKTFGNTLMREGAKAIMGMLGLKSKRRR